MLPNDLERLRHMLDAAREAVTFLGRRPGGDVAHDRMLALSLVKLIEIVGEAAVHVSPDMRARTPAIDWPRVVATRNRLIHGYFDVDAEIVAQTVREDFPPLIAALEEALARA